MTSKISDGANDRSRDDTIAQTGPGLPDDTSKPVEASEEEIEQIRRKLVGETDREKLLREVQDEIDLPQKGSA